MLFVSNQRDHVKKTFYIYPLRAIVLKPVSIGTFPVCTRLFWTCSFRRFFEIPENGKSCRYEQPVFSQRNGA